jgi:hypothetical protein
MQQVKHSDAYKPPVQTVGGFNGYQVVSAMQKCIRRGLERDALYWATELWASCNQTGREYIWHRLRVIASEDVGLADNNACVQVSALYANFTRRPNEKIFLWHAVLLLTRAPKSRIVDHAGITVTEGNRDGQEMPDFAIDDHAGGEMNWEESLSWRIAPCRMNTKQKLAASARSKMEIVSEIGLFGLQLQHRHRMQPDFPRLRPLLRQGRSRRFRSHGIEAS